MWKRGEIAPQEQFLLFSTIFYNLILDFCVITMTRFFLRDKRLFEITEVEITRVDCIVFIWHKNSESLERHDKFRATRSIQTQLGQHRRNSADTTRPITMTSSASFPTHTNMANVF